MQSSKVLRGSKDITVIAVMCALLIGGQLILSGIPGIEVVTVLLVAFFAVFGAIRGIILAVAFSLLRCFIFGFFPTVILLYLIYYPLLAVVIGGISKLGKYAVLPVYAAAATIMTPIFSLIDCFIAPFVYGTDFYAYFLATVPVMLSQTVCAAATTLILFIPLKTLFLRVKKNMSI